MADERFRELQRRIAATGDPSDVGRLLSEAVRLGRWLRYRDQGGDWNENTYRVGTLRFLAYLGWKDAVDLLERLPLGQTGFFDAAIPIRGRALPTAFTELGPEVSKTIDPTVLAASAAAACMTVKDMLQGFPFERALALYGDAISSFRWYWESQQGLHRDASQEEKEAASSRVDVARAALHSFAFSTRLRGASEESHERSPEIYATKSASRAWSDLLSAPSFHQDSQAKGYSQAIFHAIDALAWSCEPDFEPGKRPVWRSVEWFNLPENHWMRAPRLRLDWKDTYGARPSVRCIKVARKQARDAMLGPALIAAATLVN